MSHSRHSRHSYTVDIDSSDDEDSVVSKLSPARNSTLCSNKTRPGLGLTSADNPRLECSIELINFTDLTLLDRMINLKKGQQVTEPASFMEPKTRDAFLLRGKSLGKIAIAGTSGIASWFISGENRRLVIAWSVARMPFYNNWLAVGFTKRGSAEDPSNQLLWYEEMSGSSKVPTSGVLSYKRHTFKRLSDNITSLSDNSHKSNYKICKKSKGLEVRGTMTGRRKVEVQITLYKTH